MADNHPLIIVGSGHAGLQLARNVRRLQASSGLVMICADDGVDYSKPQLSHAFSQQQTAQHLTRKTAEELRQELKMMLLNGQLFIPTNAPFRSTDARWPIANSCWQRELALLFPPWRGMLTKKY